MHPLRQLTVYLMFAVLASGCGTTLPMTDEGAARLPPDNREEQNKIPASPGGTESLLDLIEDRMTQLAKRRNWQRHANVQSLKLQGIVAEARHFERVLDTITQSAEPNLSQLNCLKSLAALRTSTAKADQLLQAQEDFDALSEIELKLEDALLNAKGCVVNYGEVAYVYFKRDNISRNENGRSVPEGLNPSFSKDNQRAFEKVLASCSKSGVIHLYGYSCDLGSVQYDEELAYERASNLKTHLEGMLRGGCGETDIRIEAHLGGIIDLIDPDGNGNDELLEHQRKLHRMTAMFLFNQNDQDH